MTEQCLVWEPKQRPSFENIISDTKDKRNHNLVDKMIIRLENYTQTLEETVAQRQHNLMQLFQFNSFKVKVKKADCFPNLYTFSFSEPCNYKMRSQ